MVSAYELYCTTAYAAEYPAPTDVHMCVGKLAAEATAALGLHTVAVAGAILATCGSAELWTFTR
jgi:hypothetical protein